MANNDFESLSFLFNSMPGRVRSRMKVKQNLFLMYTAYGYVGPFLITALVHIIDKYHWVQEKYAPRIGVNHCFIHGLKKI